MRDFKIEWVRSTTIHHPLNQSDPKLPPTVTWSVVAFFFLDEVYFNRRIINVTVSSIAIYSKVLMYMGVYTFRI